ncbi:MAG: serine/threonine-protein kinase [Pseudomonadota bacterium]
MTLAFSAAAQAVPVPAPGPGACAAAGAAPARRFGPYLLVRPLAPGVWLAGAPDGADVALKLAPGGGAAFIAAARLAAQLAHPSIVATGVSGEVDGTAYLAMEYVAGPPLRAVLENGAPPRAQALAWMTQLLAGLDYLHGRGIVHRDIKPSNLLLDARGRLKIADFGLAGAPGRAAAHGTPAYMAPEQMRGYADTRSDLYAAGVVLYQMLAGRAPYAGTPFQLMQQVLNAPPPPLPPACAAYDRLMTRALAKSLGERYQNVSGFLCDLHNCSIL